jgi:hypothetical protein
MNDNQLSAASNSPAAFDSLSYSPQLNLAHERLAGVFDETGPGEPSAEWATPVDVNYDHWRASEERTAALNARDSRVRRVHAELAERYEERVRRSMSAARRQLWL